MNTKTANDASLLIRLPTELKAALMQQAGANGRRVNAEIVTRLQISLGGKGPTLQGILAREAGLAPPKDSVPPGYLAGHQPTAALTNDNRPAPATAPTSDLDRAMLQVFHALPVEKQLALLSLFK